MNMTEQELRNAYAWAKREIQLGEDWLIDPSKMQYNSNGYLYGQDGGCTVTAKPWRKAGFMIRADWKDGLMCKTTWRVLPKLMLVAA